MPKVSIITVNFNQAEVTEQLIASIVRSGTADYELIVVDNGSSVNPVPAWKSKYPSFSFIRSETNLGFAGGNNLGTRSAIGRYLFYVNNDTEFTEGLVERLCGTLDHYPEVAVVSPKIRYFSDPEVIQYVGFTPMNFYRMQNASPGQFEKDTGQFDHLEQPTGYAHGAAMMVRSSAIAQCGLMAENYFLYYEEMDWCERFRKNGYQIWVNTDALIFHKESVSVGAKSALKEYFMNRNRLLFARKNAPIAARWFFYPYFVLLVCPRNILVYIRQKTPMFIRVLWRAVWWNVVHPVNSTVLGYTIPAIK